MPDTKSSENETDEEAKSGGGKRIAVAGLLSVGLLGGGFFAGGGLGGGGAAAEPAPAEAAEPEPEEKKEIGELVELEPVNVNLQDGHYLRVAIALEKYKSEEAASDKKKDAGDAPAFPTAPAADLVLSTFSGRAMSELSTNSGREAVRTELFEAIKAVYGDKVTSVYLTEFVMQ